MGIGQKVQFIAMNVFQVLTEGTFVREGDWFVRCSVVGASRERTMAFIQGSGRVSESAEADNFK